MKRPIKVIAGRRFDVPAGADWVRSAEDTDVPAPLAELLALSGGSKTPATWGALMSLFAAALVRGDETDPVPVEPRFRGSARSFREGARGTFYLDGFNFGVMPATKAERDIVFGTYRVDGQARRWSGIRIARAQGRDGRGGSDLVAATTAANVGTENHAKCAIRLIDDIRAYLDFQRGNVRPGPDSSASDGAVTSPAWRTLAAEVAVALDVCTPPYPQHLTPSILAQALTINVFGQGETHDAAGPEDVAFAGRIALSEALLNSRRIVVLGGPGSGKTTLLAGEVLSRLRKNEPALIVRLPDIANAVHKGDVPTDRFAIVELLCKTTFRELAIGSRDCVKTFTRALVDDRKALIALDGLDEVPPNARALIHRIIRHVRDIEGDVVVGSRSRGYSPLPGDWREATIDPIQPKFTGQFIRSWFRGKPRSHRKRAELALRTSDIAELSARPVLLGIVATVAAVEQVPFSVGLLYDRYVSILLQRSWRPPSEIRTAADDLDERFSAAMELAWFSATGGVADADEEDWIDIVSIAAFRTRRVLSNLPATQDLLENDAVLRRYGSDASALHQRYIWSHRSLQEHLVGGYLVEMLRQRREVWTEQIRRIVLGSPQWFEPLRHMAQLLSDAEQLELLDHLQKSAELGDPGGIFRDAILDLMSSLPQASAGRAEAARFFSEAGDYGAVMRVNFDLFRTKWAESVFDHDPSTIYLLGRTFEKSDAPWLVDLVHRYHNAVGADYGIEVELLRELSFIEPDVAFVTYLELVEQGYREPLHYSSMEGRSPTPSTVASLLARARHLEPHPRMMLLRSLRNSRVDLRLRSIHGEQTTAEERAVLRVVDFDDLNQSFQTSEPAVQGYRDIAMGKYGDDSAFMLGLSEKFDVFDFDDSMPLAQIGRAVRDLTRVSARSLDSHDISDELCALLRTESEVTSVTAHALRLINATSAFLSSGTETPLRIVIKVFRALMCAGWRHTKELREVWAVRSLRDAVLTMVCSYPFSDVVDEILSSDPLEWVSERQMIGLCIDLDKLLIGPFPYESGVTVNQLADVLVWAGKAGASVTRIPSRPDLLDDSELLANLVTQRNPAALSLPGNAAWFASALKDRGLLYKWHEKLISI